MCDVIDYLEEVTDTSFDLVEQREALVDTLSEDKKGCDIFQQLLDYEKKVVFPQIWHAEYETVMLGKLLIEEFILCYCSDWMDIVSKVGKFKVCCLHLSSILNINPHACECVTEDYNKQN